jgi:hypothetical protein
MASSGNAPGNASGNPEHQVPVKQAVEEAEINLHYDGPPFDIDDLIFPERQQGRERRQRCAPTQRRCTPNPDSECKRRTFGPRFGGCARCCCSRCPCTRCPCSCSGCPCKPPPPGVNEWAQLDGSGAGVMANEALPALNVIPDLEKCLIQDSMHKKRQVDSAIFGTAIIPNALFNGSNMVSVKACRFFNVYCHNENQRCRSPTLAHGKRELYMHSCEDCLAILQEPRLHPKVHERCPLNVIYRRCVRLRSQSARTLYPQAFRPLQ